jgi:NTP pyrophosphatase (non-canonical NTP hydrolase)
MNVNNVADPQEKPQCMLTEIFEKQASLMEKYHHIEKANGLLICEDNPINIHDKKGQLRLKDFFWRVTEEVGEALEALDAEDYDHFYEELADALHFLVEACILAGGLRSDIEFQKDGLVEIFNRVSTDFNADGLYMLTEDGRRYVYYRAMIFIRDIGLVGNCLKNKPWKQTHILTDEDKFHKCLWTAFVSFIALCEIAGFTAEGLYNMYFRKNEVNKFRQRSGY